MVCSGWHRQLMLLLLFSVGVWGCAASSLVPHETRVSKSIDLSNIQVQDLAGVWEYKEKNVVYPLTFDREGNGTYEWKDGHFVTTSVVDGIWRGTWNQRENDREGKFEIHLDQDLQAAVGSWWYTRIGQDHDPLAPGGTFSLKRLSLDVKESGKKNSVQGRYD